MAELDGVAVEPRGEIEDAWAFIAEISDDLSSHRLRVRVTGTTSVVAGFGEDGPSSDWVEQRVRDYGKRTLTNGLPVIEQVRDWPDPLFLHPAPK